MAITSEINRTDELVTDGVETDFDFPMLIHNKSEVQVKYKPDAGGDYTDLVLDSDYGVVFTDDGGTVSTEGYRVPLADGKLFIIRHLALTQLTNWLYNDNHTEQTHQDDFDRSVMRDIQIQGQLDRCPQFPIHSDTVGITFPEPAANEIIGWNAGGTDLTNISASALAVLIAEDIIAGDVPENLDDLADVDAVQVNGNFIVADGANWVSESGAVARTSLGLGIDDSPRFARIGLGIAPSLETCRIHEDFDHVTSGRFGLTSRVTWDPATPPGVGVCTLHAGWFQAEWAERQLDSDDGTYYVYGVEGKAKASVAAATSLDYAIGLRGVAESRDHKTLVNAIGVQSVVENDATMTLFGDITSGYNFLAQCLADKTVGTFATRYGYYFEDATGGGNLTTQYAIYCPAIAAAAGDNLFIKNISADSDFGSGDITTTGSGGFGSCVITQTSYTDGLKIVGFPPADESTLEFYVGGTYPYINGSPSWYLQANGTNVFRFRDTRIDTYRDLYTNNNDILLGSGIISTTGALGAGVITGTSFITGGDIGLAAQADLLQLADGALTVNGTITSTGSVSASILRIKDVLSANYLTVRAFGVAFTAARSLNLRMGDADRVLTFSGSPTLDDWFDQSVKIAAEPTFGALTITNGLTVNTTDLVVDNVNHRVEIGSADGSDKIQIYHDNWDAYVKWNDGNLRLMTDEGDNTNTYVDIKGKGTGAGFLRLFDEDNAERLEIVTSAQSAYFTIKGTNPGNLHFQYEAGGKITCFVSATEGETQELQIYGRRTGDALRNISIGISPDVNDTALFSNVGNYKFDGAMEVLSTADPQLRLTHTDGVDETDFYTDSDGDLHIEPTGHQVILGDGTADVDYSIFFNGETNQGLLLWDEDNDYFTHDENRGNESFWWYCKYMDAINVSKGGSGATEVLPTADTIGGYRLTAVDDYLYFNGGVCNNWDGATDIEVKIRWELGAAGAGGNTVDLTLLSRYKGNEDTACKTQTQTVPVTLVGAGQYTMYTTTFTIDWDLADNVVEEGDVFSFRLNLDVAGSEVDNVIINFGRFRYRTATKQPVYVP